MDDHRPPFIEIWTVVSDGKLVGFRATRSVLTAWRGFPHVNGGGVSGELPAFIEGVGDTPEAALEALLVNIGRAYMHAAAKESA